MWRPRPFHGFLSLIYPKLCLGCDRRLHAGEAWMCWHCKLDLPETGYHSVWDNPVFETFWGRADLSHGTAFYYYSGGQKVRRLIHEMKYRNRPEVGYLLGLSYGELLADSPWYKDIDVIVPVPLHPKKLHQRGYNQSFMFAKGLAEPLNTVAEANVLVRKGQTATQTRKTRQARWANVKGVFGLHSERHYTDTHVLLVDDVITTGATMESCARALEASPGVRVTVAAVACAREF